MSVDILLVGGIPSVGFEQENLISLINGRIVE